MTDTNRKVQQHKVDAVKKLKEHFAAAPDLIFSDFRGLTFPQMTELRAKLTEKGTAYRVVRNAFARIAMKESGLPDASPWLEGPTALAFLGKDPSPAAKVMIWLSDTPIRPKTWDSMGMAGDSGRGGPQAMQCPVRPSRARMAC